MVFHLSCRNIISGIFLWWKSQKDCAGNSYINWWKLLTCTLQTLKRKVFHQKFRKNSKLFTLSFWYLVRFSKIPWRHGRLIGVLFRSIVYRIYVFFQKYLQICFIITNNLFRLLFWVSAHDTWRYRRYLKTWTFKLLILNKFAHSINIALHLINKKLDFTF